LPGGRGGAWRGGGRVAVQKAGRTLFGAAAFAIREEMHSPVGDQ
jgi:hypothetical protein